MSEPYDSEVEKALTKGWDVEDYLYDMTHEANDPLQVALAKYAAQIERTGKVFHHLGRACDEPV